MKVIVIDDMRTNCQMAEYYLSSIPDISIETFTDPQKALDWCEHNVADLVFVDFVMPKIDGLGFIKILRGRKEYDGVPIVMITADEKSDTLHTALDSGATDFVRKPVPSHEIVARARSLLKLRAYTLELYRMATTDYLTGAFNRRHFMELARRETDRASRYDWPISLIAMDIDHFKRINDTHGHDIGDEALRAFTRACQEALRPYDIFGRLGGEEFAVLVPHSTLTVAAEVAERLRQAVASIRVPLPQEGTLAFTCSQGVSRWLVGEKTVEKALSRADAALYDAKHGGRNRVVCDYSTESDTASPAHTAPPEHETAP